MDDAIFIEVQRLCRLVHQRGLRELSLSRPDFSLSVTAIPAGTPVLLGAALPVQIAGPAGVTPADETAAPAGYAVTSPLIGLFYRSPSPDAPPFVEIGDTVEVGQIIGIVEAMKVFNEITTDQAGTVVAIPTENGALVQVDQPLIVIAPHE